MPAPAPALALALALATLSPAVFAHGPVHEQIDRVTVQLQATPNDPALYLRRAELHRFDGNHEAALADLGHAGALDPKLEALDLHKAEVLLDAGRPLQARPHADRFLRLHPRHARALQVRGRALRALGDHKAAARDLGHAVDALDKPSPDEVLELARALEQAGAPDQALRRLDHAMKTLGPVVSLQLPAIDLDRKARRWDQALARLETLAAQSPRKETWHVRRAEILTEARRSADARQALQDAIAAIAALPDHLRGTRAMLDLQTQAEQALAALGPAKKRGGSKARTR
jgi:tetratricopeptide (TPR) repeat protein